MLKTRGEKIEFMLFVIFFNGLGLWTVYEKGVEEELWKQLDREGVEIYATVEICSQTMGTCQISYRYEVPLPDSLNSGKVVSQTFRKNEGISCTKCDRLNEVDIVPIRYLPKDPAESRTIFFSGESILKIYTIILFAFPWVWLVLTFLNLKWKQWRGRTG